SFTVGDVETAAASLTVSGSSSDTTLVPNANIVFGGSGANRTVTVTPAANLIGSVTITVTVTDANSGTVTDTFVLMVTAANDPPTISNIADQTVNEDTPTGAVSFTVGDVETAAASLTVSGSSSDTTLVPNANIVFGGSGTNRTVTVTPAANLFGTATITVTVTDANSGTATDTFVLSVNAANDPPTISTFPDVTTLEDMSPATIAFTIGDDSTPTTDMTVTVTSSNTAVVPHGNSAIGGSGPDRTLTLTLLPNAHGVTTLTLTASDGSLTTNTSFVLTVTPVNDSPSLTATADQTINEDSATASVSIIVADDETQVANLVLSATSSNPVLVPNGNIVLGGSNSFRTVKVTPTENQSGVATITVTVSDGSATTSDAFDVTAIAVDDAPVWQTTGSQTTGEGLQLSFVVVATDIDTAAGQLVYSASGLPAGATFDTASHTFTWLPVNGQGPADYSVTFAVTDGTTSIPQIVSIHVNDTLKKMHRAFNPHVDFHFFTLSVSQFSNAVNQGWRDETTGQATFALFETPTPNAQPLFRLYNLQKGNHYYTPNAAERDYLVSLVPPNHPQFGTVGWRDEGIEGYVLTAPAPGATQLYRLYNRTSGVHLFTHDAANMNLILTLFPQSWERHADLGYGFVVAASVSSAPQQAESHRAPTLSLEMPESFSPRFGIEQTWPPDPRGPDQRGLEDNPPLDRPRFLTSRPQTSDVAHHTLPRMLEPHGSGRRDADQQERLAHWDRVWELIANERTSVFDKIEV
ncbi:MAG: hypothetical protein HZA46_00585, partial [Planctomycetales bacterium]|nr:hypothetical protein [Planctomycetales bacterium]